MQILQALFHLCVHHLRDLVWFLCIMHHGSYQQNLLSKLHHSVWILFLLRKGEQGQLCHVLSHLMLLLQTSPMVSFFFHLTHKEQLNTEIQEKKMSLSLSLSPLSPQLFTTFPPFNFSFSISQCLI